MQSGVAFADEKQGVSERARGMYGEGLRCQGCVRERWEPWPEGPVRSVAKHRSECGVADVATPDEGAGATCQGARPKNKMR